MEEKAFNEDMEDTSANISEAIEKLKLVLEMKYKDLRLPPNGEDILERSLHHRKFNINQAADQVHSFFKLFSELSGRNEEEIFSSSSYKSCFLDSFAMSVLKRRHLQEQPMLLFNFEAMPAETMNIDKTFALSILLMVEQGSYPVHVQNMGLVLMINLNGFQFGHVKKFSFHKLQLAAKIVQGSLPIHVHGNDLTEVYKVVERKLLPVAFGGDLSNEESIDIKFNDELCQKDDYYRRIVQHGYSSQVIKDS